MTHRTMLELNHNARLYLRGANKNGETRYLACDPQYSESNWTWTKNMAHAYFFDLNRLPELLAYVRHRPAGHAVKLWTEEATCTLAERVRQPNTGQVWD